MANENETKVCKYCKTEIPKGAKVCPNCRKKQGGIGKWIGIAVVVIILFAALGSCGGSDSETASDTNSQTTGQAQNTTNASNETEAPEVEAPEAEVQEEVSNIFEVGDIAELDQVKITFLSAEEYVSDNQFMQPKEGNTYYKIGFEVENIGDTDVLVSSWDWECYADGYSTEQTYFDDESIDATLSSGKKTRGYIFFEVPADAEEITLEYETNFWTEDKIIFVVK